MAWGVDDAARERMLELAQITPDGWEDASTNWSIRDPALRYEQIDYRDDHGQFTVELAGQVGETSFLLSCRLCGSGDLVIPFETAAARGRWAAGHRDATGHDTWWVHDHTPKEAT